MVCLLVGLSRVNGKIGKLWIKGRKEELDGGNVGGGMWWRGGGVMGKDLSGVMGRGSVNLGLS